MNALGFDEIIFIYEVLDPTKILRICLWMQQLFTVIIVSVIISFQLDNFLIYSVCQPDVNAKKPKSKIKKSSTGAPSITSQQNKSS